LSDRIYTAATYGPHQSGAIPPVWITLTNCPVITIEIHLQHPFGGGPIGAVKEYHNRFISGLSCACFVAVVSSGLPMLDGLLGGGFPDRSVILIVGTEGAGKERLGYKFMDVGLANGDFCLYATRLSARDAKLEGVASGLKTDRMPSWIATEGGDAKVDMNDLASISFNIKGLLNKNRGRRMRLVLDFLSPCLILNQPETVHRFLSQLFAEVKQHDAVLLGLLERDMHKPEVVAAMEDLFDGVIVLSQAAPSPGAMPQVSVKKMRGVPLLQPPHGLSERKSAAAETDPKAAQGHGTVVLRLAVLPFVNMSPDPQDEFFADGLTEEMITELSRIPGLRVIARTSIMHYKNLTKGVEEIGRELGVGSILEGSVRKAGNKIRIAAQLIDATNEEHLWADSYDRELTDIFVIQSEIATRVASVLKVTLLDSDRKRLVKAPTNDPEAYALYLKARSHYLRDTEEDMKEAVDLYQKAIEKDPRFALAYAWLSVNMFQMVFSEAAPPAELLRKGEEFARLALALDPSLPEAHLALSYALFIRWDFKGWDAEHSRALELDPNSPTILGISAEIMLFKGRFDESATLARRALELDPLSPTMLQFVANALLYSGHTDDAIALYEKVLGIDPEAAIARDCIGLAYVEKGMFEEGVASIREAMRMSKGFNPSTASDLAYALGKAGRSAELAELLSDALEWHETNQRGATAVASIYANLREADKAFEWLDRAYQEHSGLLPTIVFDFAFENIRSDPRWGSFMGRLGLR
jgi:TolB-like protein/KaiC/GvpD/RAD55 family RecA-like ATPase/tetratricopeptide (TPR) repeat protein